MRVKTSQSTSRSCRPVALCNPANANEVLRQCLTALERVGLLAPIAVIGTRGKLVGALSGAYAPG